MTFTPVRLLTAAALAASVAIIAACSGSPSSMSPTGPTAAATTASAGANFSPNPVDCEQFPDDPSCTPPPPPPTCETDPTLPECQPPTGTPCSPGYWKNHVTAFNTYCSAAVAVSDTDRFDSCGSLMTALTCRGSDASCGRNAAALLLDQVSGCVESD